MFCPQVGGVARIQCAAEGLPPPEISLRKGENDDFPAAIERRLIADAEHHVFFIKPVKLEDQGTYTCTANNTAGTWGLVLSSKICDLRWCSRLETAGAGHLE